MDRFRAIYNEKIYPVNAVKFDIVEERPRPEVEIWDKEARESLWISINEAALDKDTGLRDQEEKPIFQNDIIKYSLYLPDMQYIDGDYREVGVRTLYVDVVRWEYGTFMVGDLSLLDVLKNMSDDRTIEAGNIVFKVIGNDYEDHELVKNKVGSDNSIHWKHSDPEKD